MPNRSAVSVVVSNLMLGIIVEALSCTIVVVKFIIAIISETMLRCLYFYIDITM